MTTVFHNPRCSKSRAALALIESRGITPELVLYLEHPPGVETLRSITEMLGCSINDIIRKNEDVYKELGLGDRNPDESALLQIVADNPKLLERPIVINNGKAAIGRPPENVLTIL